MSSYITLEELDNLVVTLYTSKKLCTAGWGDLSQTDKQVYMDMATRAIENLMFRGRKVDMSQELSFPRIINGVDVGIPSSIKLAVAYLTVDNLIKDNNPRTELIRQGVKSISVGKTSESYLTDSSMMSQTIDEYIVNLYLDRYISRTTGD